MKVGCLPIPQRLEQLVESEVWPMANNSHQPIYPNLDAFRVSSKHPTLHFYPPPFHLVRASIEDNPFFWTGMEFESFFGQKPADGIDPDLSVDIGDFGHGSDAAIVLDYRNSTSKPRVVGMDWGELTGEKGWFVLANSFDELADMLGLR